MQRGQTPCHSKVFDETVRKSNAIRKDIRGRILLASVQRQLRGPRACFWLLALFLALVLAFGPPAGSLAAPLMVGPVEEARMVRRLGQVFVLERSAQGGGVSDLSCLDRTLISTKSSSQCCREGLW